MSISIATTASENTKTSVFKIVASEKNFNEIYVFGDSLSDVGNIYKATQRQYPPSPPNFQGRYSNGLVWVEYLASKLKLNSNPNNNFAFGGATTGNSTATPLGLLAQIDSFKAKHSTANPKAIYIIWAGSNDYLKGGTNTNIPTNNIAIAMQSLLKVGAKNIVVVNLPDLGKLPGTRRSQYANFLSNITKEHNSKLVTKIKGVRSQLSTDIKITYLDADSIFGQVRNNPQKFGFKNVTNACLTQAGRCNNPNDYFFWDDIHPTTAAHKLLVEPAFLALKPAPDYGFISPQIPLVSTMAMLIFGVLGIGLILKRKKA